MRQALIEDPLATAFAFSTGPHDLGPAIQNELAALAHMDARYQAAVDLLDRWPGNPVVKARRARQLEERHRRQREPHVLRLAELHQQMMADTMFRDPGPVH